MKKLFGLTFLYLVINMATAQSYSPKTIGSKWFYKMGDQSFTDEITDNNYEFKDKTYFKNLRTYSWGDTDESYFRVDDTGTTYYLDTKSKLESIDIPGKPKVGDSWTSADKGMEIFHH